MRTVLCICLHIDVVWVAGTYELVNTDREDLPEKADSYGTTKV